METGEYSDDKLDLIFLQMKPMISQVNNDFELFGEAYTISVSVDIVGDADSTNNDDEIATVALTVTKYVVGKKKLGTWCILPRGFNWPIWTTIHKLL